MALKDQMRRWLRRLMVPGSKALGIHDSIEATFSEVASDLAQMDADTILNTTPASGPGISSTALDRWGIDLAEPRLPGQTDAQYATMLQQIKQGKAVNESGLRYALDKWGLSYTLLEFGDANSFWDQGFYDQSVASVPPLQIQIVFSDPFNGATPTAAQKAAAQTSLTNAVRDANRVKARGVQVIAVVPSSLQ